MPPNHRTSVGRRFRVVVDSPTWSTVVIEMPVLDTVALVIILGAALLVSGAVVVTSIREMRTEEAPPTAQTAD